MLSLQAMSVFSLQYNNLTNAKKVFTAMVVCVLIASCAPEPCNNTYNSQLQSHKPYLEYLSLPEVTANSSNQFSIDFQQEFKSVGAVAVSCDTSVPRAELRFDNSNFSGNALTDSSERLSKRSTFYGALSGTMYAPTDDSFASSGALVNFPRGKYNLKLDFNSLSSSIKPYLLVKYSIPNRQSLTINLIAVKTAGGAQSLSDAKDLFKNNVVKFVKKIYERRVSSGNPNTSAKDLAALTLNFNTHYLDKASFANIDSVEEWNELSSYDGSAFVGGKPKQGEVNVFVITSFSKNIEAELNAEKGSSLVGLAPLPGAFGMQGLVQSSVTVEYKRNSNQLAFTIAHELGHFLGLFHPEDDKNHLTVSSTTNNLMAPRLPRNTLSAKLTTKQRKVIELNPTLIPAQ